MIRRIQAFNYRCLRHLDISLDRFQLLTGPAGSGKSTLLDALEFLGDLVREGPEAAVGKRTGDFRDLVWGRPEDDQGFELAVEFDVPDECRQLLPKERDFRVYRYEVALRVDERGPRIHSERGILAPAPKLVPAQENLFPDFATTPPTILATARPGASTVLSKPPGGNDWFYRETSPWRGWRDTRINLGPRRSALGCLPESPETMPVATALKRALETGVRRVCLDVAALNRACPPGAPADASLAADGSNLPWVVKRLREEHRADFDEWVGHVKTLAPGLEDIRVAEREADRHAYLVLRYANDLDVPSWVESAGTLRLLAMTLLAYLPDKGRIHLVDEPENGVHPPALNAIRDSLLSVRGSQVLATTSSMDFLRLFEPREVLCFARNTQGATRVVRGSEHPVLADREGPLDMSVLVAGVGAEID